VSHRSSRASTVASAWMNGPSSRSRKTSRRPGVDAEVRALRVDGRREEHDPGTEPHDGFPLGESAGENARHEG
jgi:hypothetical protein